MPLSVALISDVQYAPYKSMYNYDGTKLRHYRYALNHLKRAFAAFRARRIQHVVQLGDLIDGWCLRANMLSESLKCVQLVYQTYTKCTKNFIYNIIGNHELYNLSRRDIVENCNRLLVNDFMMQCLNESEALLNNAHMPIYYSTYLGENQRWKLIILDAFDVSILGIERDHYDVWLKNMDHLKSMNANANVNSSIGLKHPHFVAYNGGIGQIQLRWLTDQLKQTTADSPNILICCHCPVLSTRTETNKLLVWNWEEVLKVVRACAQVRIFVYGHTHSAFVDEDINDFGTKYHHIGMPAVVEYEEREDIVPYAVLHLEENGFAFEPCHGMDAFEATWQ